jgi:HEPN domain-containing protein
MLPTADVKRLASARLRDAKALLAAGRYDGAVYMCGYSVELALKARICRTLKWPGFPEKEQEFKGLSSLKVHDLDALLRFTGREAVVKTTLLAEWSVVAAWNPGARYKPVGSSTPKDTQLMLDSAAVLMRHI